VRERAGGEVARVPGGEAISTARRGSARARPGRLGGVQAARARDRQGRRRGVRARRRAALLDPLQRVHGRTLGLLSRRGGGRGVADRGGEAGAGAIEGVSAGGGGERGVLSG